MLLISRSLVAFDEDKVAVSRVLSFAMFVQESVRITQMFRRDEYLGWGCGEDTARIFGVSWRSFTKFVSSFPNLSELLAASGWRRRGRKQPIGAGLGRSDSHPTKPLSGSFVDFALRH